MASTDTDVAGKHGRERKRDLGDGTIADVSVGVDADGNALSRTNPIAVESLPASTFFGGFLLDTLGSSQMAGDWRFIGTPIEVHNGINDVYWTGVSVVGNSVTFDDATRGFNSTQSILIANMADGDIFDLDAGGPVDVSGHVALEIRVWVVGNYAGDVMTIEGWDGAATVGTPVNLANYIQEDQTGGWQSAVIPREDLGFDVAGTITRLRVRQGAKIGPAPTLSLDGIRFQESGGARVFSTTAPPGTRIRIGCLFITVTDAFTLSVASGSVKGLPPLALMSVPELENGILVAQMINGAFFVQGVTKNFRDALKFGFNVEDPLTDGTNTTVRLVTLFDPPLLIEGAPELNSFMFILSDELAWTDAEVFWTGSIDPI